MLYLIHCAYTQGNCKEKRYAIYDDEKAMLKFSSLQVVRSIMNKQKIDGLCFDKIKNIKVINYINHEDIFYDTVKQGFRMKKPITIVNPQKYFHGWFNGITITYASKSRFYYLQHSVNITEILQGFISNGVVEDTMLSFLISSNDFIRKNKGNFEVTLPIDCLNNIFLNVERLFYDLTDNHKVILSSDVGYTKSGDIVTFGYSSLLSFKGFNHFFDNYRPHIIDFSACLDDIQQPLSDKYCFNPIIHNYCIYIFNKKQITLMKKFCIPVSMIK